MVLGWDSQVRKRVGGHDEAILSQGFWSYIFLRRSDASYVFSCESGQRERQGLIISTITNCVLMREEE
jgi:hypothetical protein